MKNVNFISFSCYYLIISFLANKDKSMAILASCGFNSLLKLEPSNQFSKGHFFRRIQIDAATLASDAIKTKMKFESTDILIMLSKRAVFDK